MTVMCIRFGLRDDGIIGKKASEGPRSLSFESKDSIEASAMMLLADRGKIMMFPIRPQDESCYPRPPFRRIVLTPTAA